jgi:maltose O-acetyltransferase
MAMHTRVAARHHSRTRQLWFDIVVNGFLATSLPLLTQERRGRMLARAGVSAAGARVMPHVRFGSNLVTLEPTAFVNEGVVFDGNDEIHVGRGVALAPYVHLLTSDHEIGAPEARVGPLKTGPIVVGDGAWVGARSVILPGVTIGAGAIVAAGAVVTKDVAPNVLVAGVPARFVRDLAGVPAVLDGQV